MTDRAPCRAEIGYYRRKDEDHALCFVDISESGAVAPEGITKERAMKRFHVRASDGRLLSGAAAFVDVWTRLPRWRWAARAAALPGALITLERPNPVTRRPAPMSGVPACAKSRASIAGIVVTEC